MGWSFVYSWQTVEQAAAGVTRDMQASGWEVHEQKRTREDGHSVLWTLATVPLRDGGTRTIILCDLLAKQDGCWGSTGMNEEVHPFYYSCPLSFLDRAPEVSGEWRAKVRAFHAAKKSRPKLAPGQVYRLTPGCKLQGESVAGLAVRVVSARPLVVEFVEGTAQSPGLPGFRAKVSRRSLTGEVLPAPEVQAAAQ